MTKYPVGTVVIATVRGVPGQQAVSAPNGGGHFHWFSPSTVKGDYWHADDDLADIEVVYTPPRMAEPDPVKWQVVAHTESNLKRIRWFRTPLVNTHWYSEFGSFCAWAELINPEPYRPDDAAVTP